MFRTLSAVPRFLWLLLLPCAVALPAQQMPAIANGSYTRTVWHANDGLPEDTVQALAESPGGELWIGTTGGVSTFDGAHIRAVHAETIPAVGVNSVFCLLAEHDGTIWAGTEGGGLLRFDGRHWRAFSSADGLTDGFVRQILRDSRGRLWIGTDDGLFQSTGAAFQRVDKTAEFPQMAVHAIAEDSSHRIWVGGSSLVAIAPDNTVTRYRLPGAYSESRVKSILEARDHTVWVGTVGGMARLDPTGFHSVPGLHATVRTLLQTSDGRLWIGTIGHGLWAYRAGGPLTRVAPPDLLPSDTILSLMQDDSAQLWVGTQNGLVRLNSTPVQMVMLPAGGDSDFETISGDNSGTIRVSAQRLYRIQGRTATPEALPGLNGVSVRNVFVSREHDLWIGTDGSGAYRLSPNGTTTHYSAPQELTNNFVRAFLESAEGAIWIATDEGVSSIDRGHVRQLSQASGLAYFSTRCLFEARDGTIWIGTDRGLSAWKHSAFLRNAATTALAHEKVWSILQDHTGTLWFGTRDHGLFRDRDGRVEQITTEQGLPTNSIYQLLEDRHGFLWLTGPNIIASVSMTQMDGPLPTATRPVSVTTYAMPFGAEDAQLYGGRQPAGYLAPDDSVWFPTTRGVARVQRADTGHPGSPPRVVMQTLEEDGRATNLVDGRGVDAAVTRLSFQFSAIDLRPRGGLRFRYKLEGLDQDWIAAGPSENATYTNLKPAHYRLRVQAFEASAPAQISETSFSFIKRRYFYQAWWFYVLCLLLAAGLGWTIYQLRIRRIRARFAAVLEERTRLAREIHDTVIQGCTGLSAVLEAMSIESANKESSQSTELLDYARVQTRGVIDEARRAVWNMRSEREEQLDLVAALHLLADQTMREHPDIAVEVQSAAPALLPTSIHHEAMMAIREALGNAVQHSGSDRMEIAVSSAARTLTILVRDFGRGIPADQVMPPSPGHFGIIGMRERMKKIGAQMEIRTDAGTEVRFTIVLAQRRRERMPQPS